MAAISKPKGSCDRDFQQGRETLTGPRGEGETPATGPPPRSQAEAPTARGNPVGGQRGALSVRRRASREREGVAGAGGRALMARPIGGWWEAWPHRGRDTS